MNRIAGAALGAALLFAPVGALAAPSGWTATQKSSSPGSPNAQSAEVSYGHHRLRIDNPQQRLIIDFESGALLYIDVGNKRYARVTLEEMVALRDKSLKMVESRLDEMPEQLQQQMRAQLEAAKKKAHETIDAKPTGASDAVGSIKCKVYAWTSSDGDGEACVATKLPFDPAAFQKDSLRLAKKMRKLGAGSAAASMAILRLGKLGLPVRIRQQMQMGPNKMQIVSTFEDIKASKLPKSHFAAPKGFAKQDFETMMQEAVGGPPSMPR